MHAVYAPPKGPAFDMSVSARDEKAQNLSSEVLLSLQLRRHVTSQSPKSRKSPVEVRPPSGENFSIDSAATTMTKFWMHGYMRSSAHTSDTEPRAGWLKPMFNVARKGLLPLPGGAPNDNPVSSVKFLDEQNIRDRVLTAEEFQRMVGFAPDYLKPVLLCAYHTGM